MALTYRNTVKGHVVNVPEPSDILAAAETEAERLLRKGSTPDRLAAELLMDKARSQALHQRQTLTKMDESRKWERYVAHPVVAPVPESVRETVVEPVQMPAAVSAKPAKATAKAEGAA